MASPSKYIARMTKADRDSFVAAMRILRPFGVSLVSAVTEYATAAGILSGHSSLVGAATDYASAVGILDGRSSLIEAARDFVAKSEMRLIPIRVGKAVEKMISIHEFELGPVKVNAFGGEKRDF